MGWLGPALVGLVVSGLLGLLAPRLIARLPEPEPTAGTSPEPAPSGTPETDAALAAEQAPRRTPVLAPPPPKEPYAEMAALPGLGRKMAVASALVGGASGGVLGWTGALVYLLPLVPVGVVLLVIDWRTTLLPTRVLHPTYAALAVLIPAAALIDQDLGSLYRAGWGWLVVGGWFWVFWAMLRAWGFGDVRLARVLGPALGYLGWSQVLTGLVLMVLLGGLGGAVLGLRDRSLRKRFPYGPFMLVGAATAGLAGPWIAGGLGY